MREAFAIAKASHIFSTKNIGVFKILTFEILTKRKLTKLYFEQLGSGMCTQNS